VFGPSSRCVSLCAVRAGTDVDCGAFVPKFAQSALDKGVVNETDIDAALQHLMLMKIRLGYFDRQPSPLASIGADQVCSPSARQLARDAARQGTVLLKNDAAALPLARGISVAAIGPNVALSQTLALCARLPLP
jgi:beta-D-xylosidase 4